MAAFTQLAAQLGYLRLSATGWRWSGRAAQQGQRRQSGHRGDRRQIPDKHPGGGCSAAAVRCGPRLLLTARGPAAGRAPAGHRQPRADAPGAAGAGAARRELGGAEAAEVADRALQLDRGAGSIRRRRSRRQAATGRGGGG